METTRATENLENIDTRIPKAKSNVFSVNIKLVDFKKIFQLLNQLKVEPIIFFHVSVLLMTHLCTEDLMLDRTCRINLNFSSDICNALSSREIGNYTLE